MCSGKVRCDHLSLIAAAALSAPDVTQTLFSSFEPIKHHGMSREPGFTPTALPLLSAVEMGVFHIVHPQCDRLGSVPKTPKEVERGVAVTPLLYPLQPGSKRGGGWITDTGELRLLMFSGQTLLIVEVE